MMKNLRSDYYGIGEYKELLGGGTAQKKGRIRIDGECIIESILKSPYETSLNKKTPEQRLIFKITGLFQKDRSNERYDKPFIEGVTINNVLSFSEFIAFFKRGNPLYFRA